MTLSLTVMDVDLCGLLGRLVGRQSLGSCQLTLALRLSRAAERTPKSTRAVTVPVDRPRGAEGHSHKTD